MLLRNRSKENKRTALFADKVSIIAEGMKIAGDVTSDSDIRVDGTVQGNIYCKSRVVVVGTGKVMGDIEAVNIDIHGTVFGNVTAIEALSLKSNCSIEGNLVTVKLQIEPNALFTGYCTMKKDAAERLTEKELRLQPN